MNNLIRAIKKVAQNAPLYGYIKSSDYCTKEIKRDYNLNDYQLCELLEYMKYEGLIRDFGFQFSTAVPDVIYKYWFR